VVDLNGKVEAIPAPPGQSLATTLPGSNLMIYRAFPVKKGQILVRIENTADKFDSRTAYLKREIDVK